jgi:hypothetical protein
MANIKFEVFYKYGKENTERSTVVEASSGRLAEIKVKQDKGATIKITKVVSKGTGQPAKATKDAATILDELTEEVKDAGPDTAKFHKFEIHYIDENKHENETYVKALSEKEAREKAKASIGSLRIVKVIAMDARSSTEVREMIKGAPMGALATGGGYGPFKKISGSSWQNQDSSKRLCTNESLYERIGGFSDFKIKGGSRDEDTVETRAQDASNAWNKMNAQAQDADITVTVAQMKSIIEKAKAAKNDYEKAIKSKDKTQENTANKKFKSVMEKLEDTLYKGTCSKDKEVSSFAKSNYGLIDKLYNY